jgi:hypothetical protein
MRVPWGSEAAAPEGHWRLCVKSVSNSNTGLCNWFRFNRPNHAILINLVGAEVSVQVENYQVVTEFQPFYSSFQVTKAAHLRAHPSFCDCVCLGIHHALESSQGHELTIHIKERGTACSPLHP